MSAMKLRMSQVSRLVSRDYRDILSFIAFMMKRFPTSIIDRVQGTLRLKKRVPDFHPNCIENSKYPILEIDSLYLYGKKLYNGDPAKFLNSETFVYWPPDWNGGDLRNWGTGLSQGIRYYGKGITDDIKETWEVHRLQWVPSLAFVAKREKDATLAGELLDQVIRYWEIHPKNRTVSWMEGIEVSIRSISIIESLSFLKDLIVDDERVAKIYHILSEHAEWLSSHLSTKWRLNNNHLIIELVGLRIIGERLKWHPKSRFWREKSERLLKKELEDQTVDGRNWEPTTAYHKLVTESMLVLRHHLENTDEVFKEITQEMVTTLSDLTPPSGKMPLVGDDDGGSLLPLYEGRSVRDNSVVLELAKNMGFSTDSTTPMKKYWHGQGMGIIREKNDYVHFVSGAPEGLARQGSHRHLDMLSVTISLDSMDLIHDGGTGGYFGDKRMRDIFRSEQCHSGVACRTKKWATMRGPFEITKPPIGIFTENENGIEISCRHPSGGEATRAIELSDGSVMLTDNLSLEVPVVRFIVKEEGNEKIDGGVWKMVFDKWSIEHQPIPESVAFIPYKAMDNPRLSVEYGIFDDCFILEFEHKKGTIAKTSIFRS